MKVIAFLVFACGMAAAQGTSPLPDLPDETVIAIFDDGAKMTMKDYRNLYAAVPAANQQNMQRDRKAFLEQYALLRKLAKMAEAAKLDQMSPNKEALEFGRMVMLGQMELSQASNNVIVSDDDIKKYYDANKSQYLQVRVKAIYISFTRAQASQISNGKRLLTEDEARAKAQKLLGELRAGADFGKLARENSDDAASRDKDGELAILHPSDNIPDAIKAAVFSLKQGEVSEPIEQPNGFYLLRAEEIGARPLSEVRAEIYGNLQGEYARKWIESTHNSVKVEFPSAEFVSGEKSPAPAK